MKKYLIVGLLLLCSCAFLGVDKEKTVEYSKEVWREAKLLGIDAVQAGIIQVELDLAKAETSEEKKELREKRISLGVEAAMIMWLATQNVLLKEKENT